MEKSAEAFRTISEVAQDLDLPQHVLRFWESRFAQIRPLKRGGGRRYYRPEDIELLRAIRQLLYGEGYTIKGVQKILKEQGVRTVASTYGAPGGTFVPPEGGFGADDFEESDEDTNGARAPRALPNAIASASGLQPGVAAGDRGLLQDLASELADCARILDAARGG
ncbi:MAG TPA: MerR family transcriptional regulator [Methylovirgula sp.]|jgi:DNA-binding transcriptional MerR regulator